MNDTHASSQPCNLKTFFENFTPHAMLEEGFSDKQSLDML